MYDIVIIGRGPAGISAALYALRANLSVAVIGKDMGSLAKAGKIENYYGLDVPLSGAELARRGVLQAMRLGASMPEGEVIDAEFDSGIFRVRTKAESYEGRALILATGSSRKSVSVEGFAEREGRGISYCAVCDGFFFRGKEVAVFGNADYALSEVNVLLPLARSVTLFTLGQPLLAEFPESVKIVTAPVTKIAGEGKVESVEAGGESFAVNGVFVALGAASATDLARKIGAGVTGNAIAVDANFATTVPGLYAAGDCTGGILQVSVAVGEGARAGLAAISFVRKSKAAVK
ncbi:MAG: NAD(P)/FAD-dependent oxidoreductase [Fibrobacteraceae bacterium]